MTNPFLPDTDIAGLDAQADPMLRYFNDWWGLQTLKCDPMRRTHLVRDAYLSGAAQGALLARRMVATIRAPATSGWLQTLPVPGPTALQWEDAPEPVAESGPTVAECIAQLDTWNGRLEAAIDRQAHEKLGQHANDEPPAGRDPLEQFP